MKIDKPNWSEQARATAGARLRRTRTQQHISIRQLAELAQISKTSVLQVESGRSSRRSTYLKVAQVLGLHLDKLTEQANLGATPYAVHRNSQDVWFDLANFDGGPLPAPCQTDPDGRRHLSERDSITPLNILQSRLEQGRIKPTTLELYAQSTERSHSGEEHVYVLSGRAAITVSKETLILEEGESITFWSAELHSYGPAPDSPLPVKLLSVRVDS